MDAEGVASVRASPIVPTRGTGHCTRELAAREMVERLFENPSIELTPE